MHKIINCLKFYS